MSNTDGQDTPFRSALTDEVIKRYPMNLSSISIEGNGFIEGAKWAEKHFESEVEQLRAELAAKPDPILLNVESTYSLMTNSNPAKREQGKKQRIHELLTQIAVLRDENSKLSLAFQELQLDRNSLREQAKEQREALERAREDTKAYHHLSHTNWEYIEAVLEKYRH